MFDHICRFWIIRHRDAVVRGDRLEALVTGRCFENYMRRDPIEAVLRSERPMIIVHGAR